MTDRAFLEQTQRVALLGLIPASLAGFTDAWPTPKPF